MANFVTRPTGYDLSLAGPFDNRSVTMQTHVLNADLGRLSTTLNRYLNDFAGTERFLPIGDRVLVSCVDIKEGRAGDRTLGSMHEVEVAFFILALHFDPFPIPRGIVSFSPYLFVNNAWAMAMGREVHGFRKDIATSFSSTTDVDSAAWGNHPRDIEHVETWAMRERGETSRLERMKILEIRHPDDPQPSTAGLQDLVTDLIGAGVGELAGALKDNVLVEAITAGGSKMVADFLESLMVGPKVTIPTVFLRQYRDPKNSKAADVQKVVTADAVGTLTGTPTRLRPSKFLLHHAASHPIAQELGLDNEKWLQSELSLEVKMDFLFKDAD
jgi:hypothetical protein